MFVATIRNNSLGKCVPVSDLKEGFDLIQQMFKTTIGRKLTETENTALQDNYEIWFTTPDGDEYTFSIGLFD